MLFDACPGPNQVSLPESPKGLGLRVLTLGFVEQCQIVEEPGDWRSSPLPYPRGLWFYSSFSMPRSMISAKLTGRPSLSVALSESERIFS